MRASEGYIDFPRSVPCGTCDGCRTTKAKEWATRCMHEYQTSGGGSWLTLTYDDQKTNPGSSLDYDHLKHFIMRLRKALPGQRVSYYAAGEYGEQNERPHFHMCLFGFWPSDAFAYPPITDRTLYRSAFLDQKWTHGNVKVGRITMASASYTAQYTLKKVYGALAAEHYKGRTPEQPRMSLKPAIGRTWFLQNWRTCLDDKIATPDGGTVPLPRYYLKLLEVISRKDAVRIALTRAALGAQEQSSDEYAQRKARAAIQAARHKLSKRSL